MGTKAASDSRVTPQHDGLIVWGAEAIGRVIGRNPRQTHHLLHKGALPARKIREVWCANAEKLIAHCSADESRQPGAQRLATSGDAP
jgi:hypothetical protein